MKRHLTGFVVSTALILVAPLVASTEDRVITATASARDCETAYIEALRRLIQRHGAVLIETLGREQTQVAGSREQTDVTNETETLLGGLFRTRFVRTQSDKSGCIADITVTQEELADSQEAWLELLETKRGQDMVLGKLAELQNDVAALQTALRSQPVMRGESTPTAGAGAQASRPTGGPPATTRILAHPPRILFVRIDAAMEANGDPFTLISSLPLYGQSASMKSSYAFEPPRAIDGSQLGGTIRVWKHFAIGATRTRTKASFSSTVNAGIPSPYSGYPSRTADATFFGLTRSQDILHIELTATAGNDDFEASVYAGPSLMKVSQELITGITVRDTFAYTTITSGQSRVVDTDSTTGFNLGFDITWFFVRYFGFGGGVRYSRGVGRVTFQGRPSEVVMGAAQVSIGARARF